MAFTGKLPLFAHIILLITIIKVAEARSASATTIVYPVATTETSATTTELTKYEKGEQDYDEAVAEARGMDYSDHYHDHEQYHDHDHHVVAVKEEKKAIKTDPWAGYYDFIIQEGSFKFWAAFQLGTALLLVYSACAAIYYAKLNPITTDYDYYDDFLFRSNGRSADGNNAPLPSATHSGGNSWFGGLSAQTFQRILSAITSKKYS